MKKTSQLPQTKFRSNVIEIFEPVNPESEHRVYFKDRNGNEVYCHHEDPQILLDLHQKEDYFMGTYIFTVPDSIIKDLEKKINWPVQKNWKQECRELKDCGCTGVCAYAPKPDKEIKPYTNDQGATMGTSY